MSEISTSATMHKTGSDAESSTYTPSLLVDEFKRQGKFDEIRKRILNDFQQSEHFSSFLQQAEESMLRFVESHADRLVFRDARLRHSDLMRELDRIPLLDQLVRDVSQQHSEQVPSDHRELAILGQHSVTASDIRHQLDTMVQTDDVRRTENKHVL